MTLPLSPGAAKALALLRGAGYEAWIVGGCVRDALLGLAPKDYDLATSALPEQTKAVFAGRPVVETGLRHGTVTVLLEGEPLEITTYRVDGAYSDARHPDEVTFTGSLREDAARRDFTINAMAYAPGAGLQDFFGGREDLVRGMIRAVGTAEQRFREDALRILRALRFAAVLDFTLEGETDRAARACAPLLAGVSAERVSGELGKLLCGKAAGRVLREYPDVLGVVLPEILPMVGLDHRNAYHCYDVWTHTAVAVDHVPPELPLRLAMLLHDIGKPDTFSLGEDGQGHFYGHPRRSVELAEKILTRLRFPRRTRERVLTLVRYHDAVLEETPQRVRRWLNKLGPEAFFDLLAIQWGDASAQAPAYCTRLDHVRRLETMARQELAQAPCLTVRDLAVGGEDLLARGYRGPAVGEALRALLDQVLAGALPNEKTPLLQWLARRDAEKREKTELPKAPPRP
ncbi:CCA tRNA nucleotidyltransferase [Evtepia sp.]